jgi:hypothetical protein
MTLQIKEIGGLPEGEMKLPIQDAADRRKAALDTKLSAHRDEITKRLERTEDKVDDNLNRLVDLQGSVSGLESSFASTSEDNKEQTKLLQEVVKLGRDRHEDDLTYRSDVQRRLTKIEAEQKSTAHEVKRLRKQGLERFLVGKAFNCGSRAKNGSNSVNAISLFPAVSALHAQPFLAPIGSRHGSRSQRELRLRP